MAIKKERNKHLTDDLRLELEIALHERKSFSQIKRELGIPRSTIKREIMNRSVESTKTFYGRRFNPCVHRRLFAAVLADLGTEFSNPLAIETSPFSGEQRTSVFYTRPHTPTDKAHVERNHEYIRRVVLKGESFDSLAQSQIDLMMSHVNSYVRASLMDDKTAPCRTPYERFAFEFGEETARRLGIVPIPLKDVTLRPELLK